MAENSAGRRGADAVSSAVRGFAHDHRGARFMGAAALSFCWSVLGYFSSGAVVDKEGRRGVRTLLGKINFFFFDTKNYRIFPMPIKAYKILIMH